MYLYIEDLKKLEQLEQLEQMSKTAGKHVKILFQFEKRSWNKIQRIAQNRR